jgi:hypothetical protein
MFGVSLQPSRYGSSDWPAGDTTIFQLSSFKWNSPPMNFDQFLGLADGLGVEPYCVLNYDSGNFPTSTSAPMWQVNMLLY